MTGNLGRREVLRQMALAGLAWQGAGLVHAQESRNAYTVAVVPQFPAADVHRDWSPLLEQLGRTLGIGLRLQVAPSIPRFESEVLAGGPDFVYLNPYHQVMAARAQGYQPLVRGRTLLTGILVVRRDDPIRSVKELDGKTLAFPAPNAFGASLWMRALLAEREQIRITPNYVQTHGNVYRQVIRGVCAAGGGVNHTLTQEPPEVRAELRVLMETPGVAPHPLSAHPRVGAALARAMGDAMISLAATAEGRSLFQAVEMDGLTRADYRRDYHPLEAYGLDRYVVAARPA